MIRGTQLSHWTQEVIRVRSKQPLRSGPVQHYDMKRDVYEILPTTAEPMGESSARIYSQIVEVFLPATKRGAVNVTEQRCKWNYDSTKPGVAKVEVDGGITWDISYTVTK